MTPMTPDEVLGELEPLEPLESLGPSEERLERIMDEWDRKQRHK